MFVGVLRLVLQIPSARSLKDRRRVVRSFKDRVQSKLRVSIAEVGGLDQHQRAVLGVAAVSIDASRVDELLSAAASMAGGLRDAILVDRSIEILPFGDEGTGVGGGRHHIETLPLDERSLEDRSLEDCEEDWESDSELDEVGR